MKRKCPQCDLELKYTTKSNYNAAVKAKSLCKTCTIPKFENKGDLSVLLEENCLSYYWIGFLLADGHFSTENLIKCTLSSVDKNHIFELQKFLKIKNVQLEKNGKYIGIKTMDTQLVPKIKKKFNISNTKTFNPPNLDFIKNKDLFLSLVAGFIDGDGCIAVKNNSFSLTVKCHSSWLENLDKFAKFINATTNAKINNAGYAYFTICNIQSLQSLKKDVLRLKLPILERKWNKIKLDYVKNEEAHERNFKTFEKLFNKFKNFPHFEQRFNKLIYG